MSYNHETSDGERIFSPLYADVWDTTLKHLKGSAVKVYIALLMHTTQQDRTWFMSIDEIAEDAGISRSAASDGKNKLVEVGLIQQRWRYRDEAGNYHLAIKRPPPRLQGKNVYTVKVKPVSVDAENQQEDANRVRNSTSIESENQHLVESEIQHQTITPTPEPPTEPLPPLIPQGGDDHPSADRFDEFWEVVPKKVGKQAAKRAWMKAIKKADPSVIIAGMKRYRDDPNRSDAFTKNPQGWLNDGRWEDDPLPSRNAPSTNTAEAWLGITHQPQSFGSVLDGEVIDQRELTS